MKCQPTVFALFIIFSLTLGGMARAATVTCTVDSLADGKVILACDEATDTLTPGTEVKVRTVTKRKKLEGC